MRYLFILLLLVAFTGCGGGSVDEVPQGQSANLGGSAQEPAAGFLEGTVVETMNAGGYTYVLVDTGSEKQWAAGPEQSMEVGTHVKISTAMPMENFHSSALERDFDVVYFVGEFGDHDHGEGSDHEHAEGEGADAGHGAMGGMPAGHGTMGGGADAAGDVDFSGITAADQTVAAIYAEKDALAGKPVKVRGKVVKALSGIMGTNWLHIQDGTGETGTSDLTVTSDTIAPVGSTVLIEGTLTTDKDFGAGYNYSVIVENAKVTVE